MIVAQLQGTRTGSTYFYRCLASHPNIKAYPEIFRISPERVDLRFMMPGFGGDQLITFKLMYNHVKHFRLFDSLKHLKVMHIIRTPLYKKVLSDVTSNIINQGDQQVHYDPQLFLNHVRSYIDLVEQYRVLRDFTEYQEFSSDDFISEDSTMPEQVGRCVCCFLGVDYHPMKSDSKKLTPNKPHWNYFSNADQIQEVLARNGYL